MPQLLKKIIFFTLVFARFFATHATPEKQNVLDFCRVNADNQQCQAIEQIFSYFKNKLESNLDLNMFDLANQNLYYQACILGRQLNWDSARVLAESEILNNELKIRLILNEKRQQKIKLTREELLNSASFY